MKSKYICLIIIFLIISSSIISQEIIAKRDTYFDNEFVYRAHQISSLGKIDFNFKGYLVIKINDNQVYKDSSTYYTQIYWINSLDDFGNEDQHYLYKNFISLWLSECCLSDNSCSETVENYINLFTTMNNYSKGIYNTYLYSSEDWVSTNILDTTQLWTKNNENYVILNSWFIATIVNVYNSKKINGVNERYRFRTFIPVSPLLYFKEIEEAEATKYSFKKSSYKVKLR